MNDPNDLAELAALPPRDVRTDEAARLRHRAHVAFDAAHQGDATSPLVALWSRFGVPLVLASVVCVYLGWAVQATAAMYR